MRDVSKMELIHMERLIKECEHKMIHHFDLDARAAKELKVELIKLNKQVKALYKKLEENNV